MLARLQRTQSMIAGTSVRRLLLALNLLASGTGASCVGPKGDKGDPGATGDAGPKGDKGDKGEPGVSCVVAPGDSIQSCIDAVAGHGGGTVLLRAGTHTVTTPVHIHADNIELRGEGAATMLALANQANAPVILIGRDPAIVNPDETPGEAPVRNVQIHDLSIDGNNAHQSSEAWSTHPHINNSGIAVRFGEQIVIRNVTVEKARSAAILVEKSTRGFVVDSVELRKSTLDGFSCNKSYEGRITTSRMTNNGAAGVTGTCDCSDNLFTNNVISGNASNGFFLAEAHRNLIADNLIDGNRDAALLLKGVDCQVTATGASLNYFANNRITRHVGLCAVFLNPSPQLPGTGNVAEATFYQGNQVNGVCNADATMYDDRAPIVVQANATQ